MVRPRHDGARLPPLLVDLPGGAYGKLTQIPLYALYLLYTHILAPYVLGRGRAPPQATHDKAPAASNEPALSKRQAKLQARQARGATVRQVRRA